MNVQKTLITALLSVSFLTYVQAQPTNYVWSGGQSGNWEQNSNWSPEVPDGLVIGGSENATDEVQDRVTINGNYTVTRTGDLYFRTESTTIPKGGAFDAITLLGGATLNVSGQLRVTTSSGNSAAGISHFTRNVIVGAGSTLNAGEIQTGTQNNTSRISTWTINGTVNTELFRGWQGWTTNTIAGQGYVLNVDGGTFNVSDTFTWGYRRSQNTNTHRGEINISNGGTVLISSMDTDWTNTTGNFVNFVDGTGSLKFGYTNWDLASVQALIDNNYIRTSAEGISLHLSDVGDGWLVSAAIPEASTTALLIGGAALVLCGISRRMKKGTALSRDLLP